MVICHHLKMCTCREHFFPWPHVQYVYIWVSVCWDSQNCVDSVVFPDHVGGYPIVCSDQITFGLCWFCVYLLMDLIVCAQLSSKPAVCCYLHHKAYLGKGLYLLSKEILNWILCVCDRESVCISLSMPSQYFIQAPITMVLCITFTVVTVTKPDPYMLGVCFTFIFTGKLRPSLHPSTSFRLLLSAAWCCKDEWDEGQDVCMCLCVNVAIGTDTDKSSVFSYISLYVFMCVYRTYRLAFREKCYGWKYALYFCCTWSSKGTLGSLSMASNTEYNNSVSLNLWNLYVTFKTHFLIISIN